MVGDMVRNGREGEGTGRGRRLPRSTCYATLLRSSPVEWADDELAQRWILGAVKVDPYFAIHLDRGVVTPARWDDFIGAREGDGAGGVACEPGRADAVVGAARCDAGPHGMDEVAVH